MAQPFLLLGLFWGMAVWSRSTRFLVLLGAGKAGKDTRVRHRRACGPVCFVSQKKMEKEKRDSHRSGPKCGGSE